MSEGERRGFLIELIRLSYVRDEIDLALEMFKNEVSYFMKIKPWLTLTL
jgi:hypothetical protein